MNIASLQTNSNKKLSVDFDQYTDGDAAFKKELIFLMIENLKEIQDSVLEAMQNNSIDLFEKTSHKIKPTLAILEDRELMESLEAVRSEFYNDAKKAKAITHLIFVCDHIITSLGSENC